MLQPPSVLTRLTFPSASHRYSSLTLLRYRQLQWPLLITHTVAFRVTLAYSPAVTSTIIQQEPLMSHGFHTSPTSFCANCYSLANCYNFLNYYIISYNLVTCWTEKEPQPTCSSSFIKKYEIKLAPLLKKFPKSHYGNNIGSETSASTDFIVMINFAFVLFNACSIHIIDDWLLHFNIFMKLQMLSISLLRYETIIVVHAHGCSPHVHTLCLIFYLWIAQISWL